MGMFGKILLFVNFLAFGGLVYTATQDYSARQLTAANAARHQLVLVGLPVDTPKGTTASDDSIPLDLTVSGAMPIGPVSTKFLTDHFAGTTGEEYAGGPAPRTQLSEVAEAQKKLFAKLASMSAKEQLNLLSGEYTAGPNGQTKFTPGLLTILSESYAERGFNRQLNEPGQFQRQPARLEANAKLAMDRLAAKFEALQKIDATQADQDAAAIKDASEALRKTNDDAKRKYEAYARLLNDGNVEASAKQAATQEALDALEQLSQAYRKYQGIISSLNQTSCRDEADRRKRIAHLLMHLSESAGWQKRVVLVVGLRTYLAAVSDHVNRIQRMIAANEQQVYLDQARFADEYDLLKTLANGQALLLQQQIAVRVDQQLQRSLDEEAVRLRLQYLEERRKVLAKLEADVQQALVQQAEVEKAIFELHQRIGTTLEQNYAKELELSRQESRP